MIDNDLKSSDGEFIKIYCRIIGFIKPHAHSDVPDKIFRILPFLLMRVWNPQV